MSYKKFYIQKLASGSKMKDSVADFGIYCKDIPFKMFGEVKELYANEWHDQHGKDEYVPSTLMMSEYEIDVEFAYKGAYNSANTHVKTFLNYLLGIGTGNAGADMKIYSEHTGVGRTKVRVKSIDDNCVLDRTENGDILIFTVKFVVNDPVTDVKLNSTKTSLV